MTLTDILISTGLWAAVAQLRFGFRGLRADMGYQSRRLDRVEVHLGLPALPREEN